VWIRAFSFTLSHHEMRFLFYVVRGKFWEDMLGSDDRLVAKLGLVRSHQTRFLIFFIATVVTFRRSTTQCSIASLVLLSSHLSAFGKAGPYSRFLMAGDGHSNRFLTTWPSCAGFLLMLHLRDPHCRWTFPTRYPNPYPNLYSTQIKSRKRTRRGE
jgi:hypothetical protein